jgi:hypothetical protein
VVYLATFDFLQQGSAQFLFQLNINNQSGSAIFGRLRFILEKDGEEIALATSNDFNLPSGFSTINNIQLSDGYTLPGTQTEVKFSEQNLRDLDNDFEDELFEGGKLPSGIYILRALFIEPGVSEIVIASAPPAQIDVINSAYVQPITPGSEGDLTNPEVLFTEFPVFQFNTNYVDVFATGDPFNIRVFKVLPDLHQSFDDVSTTTPHLEINTDRTSFQYPPAGGGPEILEFQPLEPGTYIWQVSLTVPTTSGEDVIQSPFYAFRYVDPSALMELQMGQAAASEVLRLLRSLIGEEADEYANALSDFKLAEIKHEGSTIDLTELYRLISSYQGKSFEINYIDLSSSQ